jgi:hypothetical protein
MTFSKTYVTALELHITPHYYLTCFLCTGFCFIVDLFKTGFIFNFATSPANYLRSKISQGKRELNPQERKEFDKIHSKIVTKIVEEDMARERELDRRREELTRLVLEREKRTMDGPHSGAKIKPE